MPVLKENTEKLQTITLPSTQKLDADGNPTTPKDEWGWVVMDVSPLTTGDIAVVERGVKNAGEANVQMIAARIKEWNFTERDGTPIEISYAAMKRMDVADYGVLQAALEDGEGELTEEEKKASSATSSDSATASKIPVTTPSL